MCLYLKKSLPIVGGREIRGYPKKDAEIAFTENDREISGRVERFGTFLVSVSGKRLKRVEPGPDGPQVPFFVQKLIPSASRPHRRHSR